MAQSAERIRKEEKRREKYEADHMLDVLDASRTSPIPAKEYMERLAALDFGEADDIDDFRSDTCFDRTDAIPLGQRDGHAYFLLPAEETVPRMESSTQEPGDHDLSSVISQYQRVDLPQTTQDIIPELKYGFGIGKIVHRLVDETLDDYEDTGFYVLANALDKSIWIAIDWFPLGPDSAPTSLEGSRDWGMLPGYDNIQVGVMKISQDNWAEKRPLTIVGDTFFTNPIYRCRLERRPAVHEEFQEALRKQQQRAQIAH